VVTRARAVSDWATTPLALELNYARAQGALIAERSLREMRRQGPIDDDRPRQRWLAAMTRCSRRRGRRPHHRPAPPGQSARFLFNGTLRASGATPTSRRRSSASGWRRRPPSPACAQPAGRRP
jgi:hypothetical protein